MSPRICQAYHNQYATADKTEKTEIALSKYPFLAKVLPHVDIAFAKVLQVSLNNILALYTIVKAKKATRSALAIIKLMMKNYLAKINNNLRKIADIASKIYTLNCNLLYFIRTVQFSAIFAHNMLPHNIIAIINNSKRSVPIQIVRQMKMPDKPISPRTLSECIPNKDWRRQRRPIL